MITEIPKVKFNPMNEIHNNEVKILEQLLDAIKNNIEFDEKFELFLDDVKKHFSFEENLMEKYNFFAKIPHKMEHDRVLNEIIAMKEAQLTNDELLEYFNTYFIPWLDNHIRTMDTVTGGYFDMIGIKE